MTTIAGGSTLTQSLYQTLFDRLNTDGDDALTIGEIGSGGGSKLDFESVLKALDADVDGRVTRAEMSASSAVGGETLSALLQTQTTGQAEKIDAEILADLFVRADGDGDGALNASEMQAERDLRRAANLDAGHISGPMFVARDTDGDGLLTPDEIGVARLVDLPLTAIRFHDELPQEEQARMAAAFERMGLPTPATLSAEEKKARLDQMAADRAERASGVAGTVKFLSREIDGLRETALQDFATREMSQTLADRLLRQIAGNGART